MSSFVRKMQLRKVRAKNVKVARRLRGQVRGSKLGTVNPKAPKPNSRPARGSRRGTNKRPQRMATVVAAHLARYLARGV